MKRISSKKWVLIVLAVTWSIFMSCAVLVIVIDPYLHYRIPDNHCSYALTTRNQIFQNDGIIKHFDYNALITGSSMTENFKSSEFDKLFGANSIKVPFSGESYKAVNDACKKALETQSDLRIIVRSLDLSMLVMDKDQVRWNNYPEYLYNNELLDDVNYWLNKMTILEGCLQNVIFHSMVAKSGKASLTDFSFDNYSNWNASCNFGKQSVLADYVRPEKSLVTVKLTGEEGDMIRENVRQNVTELAGEHPDSEFLLFFTPYSICYWDSVVREGKLDWEIEAQRIAIEDMLKYDNIKLYSFCNNFEVVCNLDNYRDIAHYSELVNSQMLVWMKEGDYRLTWDNYREYLQEIYEFYSMYDYERIFK